MAAVCVREGMTDWGEGEGGKPARTTSYVMWINENKHCGTLIEPFYSRKCKSD